MVIHIFKDGSKTTEMKEAVVPKEIIMNIHRIHEQRKEKEKDEIRICAGSNN